MDFKEDAPHTKVLCTAQDTKGKEDLDKSHNKSTLHFDSQRYVQDLLREEFPNICEQILDNDAHVYVCGAAAMAEGVNKTLQVLFCIGFIVESESPDTLHIVSKHFSTFRGGIHSPRKIAKEEKKDVSFSIKRFLVFVHICYCLVVFLKPLSVAIFF